MFAHVSSFDSFAPSKARQDRADKAARYRAELAGRRLRAGVKNRESGI
jgi:hypothetical protein